MPFSPHCLVMEMAVMVVVRVGGVIAAVPLRVVARQGKVERQDSGAHHTSLTGLTCPHTAHRHPHRSASLSDALDTSHETHQEDKRTPNQASSTLQVFLLRFRGKTRKTAAVRINTGQLPEALSTWQPPARLSPLLREEVDKWKQFISSVSSVIRSGWHRPRGQ